mgnify:FL=1
MRWLLGVAGAGAGLWVYQGAWRAGWVYEDPHMLLAAPAAGLPRLLTILTWRATPDPVVAHGVNLALHGLVAAGVACLAWRLTRSRLATVVAGLGLLVQPVAVETGTYVAGGRGELLAALGIVGACVAVTWASPWRWLLAGAGLAGAALAKESAIVGLALVPLTWAVATGLTRQAWRRASMGAAACLLVGLVTVAPTDAQIRTLVNADLYAHEITAAEWAATQSTAAVRLMGVALTGRGMTLDYDYDALSWEKRTAGAVGLGLCAALTLALWRWAPVVAFGLSWMLLAVALRLVIQTPRSYLNEHQFYVSLIGLVLAIAAGFGYAPRVEDTPKE